jgi:hypothetical protein
MLWLVLVVWCCAPLALPGQITGPKQIEGDENLLKAAKLPTDDKGLLEFLRKRTLTEDLRERAELLVAQLGASSFKDREQAMTELMAKGPAVIDVVRQGLNHPDREVQRRCEICIQKVKDRDFAQAVPCAVIHLLGVRQPAGATEAILGYLPLAEADGVLDESIQVLAHLAEKDDASEKALLAALSDKSAIRRRSAGEALVLADSADSVKQVKPLLRDPDAAVRWRVGLALATAGDKEAVPALIDMLPEVALGQAWVIEDLMYRLAGDKPPPAVSLGTNEAGRKKCREAWLGWWQKNAAGTDMAVLKTAPRLVGVTTIILLDKSMVIEVDDRNNTLWHIDELNTPLDVQVLGKDRVLIAEFQSQRVTERNFKGDILWQQHFAGTDGVNGFAGQDGPIVAQRLPSGNTFIAGKTGWVEVTPDGKQVGRHRITDGEAILKCSKLPNGEVICLMQAGFDEPVSHVVRFNAKYEQIKRFRVNLGQPLFGGRIQGLADGHILIPQYFENRVVEYDSNGRNVWQIRIDQPIVATRLPNGNTLITSMNQNRAVEFDRNGQELWQFVQKDTKVTRALRR